MTRTAQVLVVPCLRDNYAYLVHDGGRALVIDPSEAEPVERALARHGLELGAVLCTHHHHDHVGGVEPLCERHRGLKVFAHRSDEGRVPRQTDSVTEGVPFEAVALTVRALHVPGHTLGAVTYCIDDAAFTGDTLFVAGCGRLFEGPAAMMHASLAKLAALPGATRVFCGHEYTVNNLRFALATEPDNQAVVNKLAWALARREHGHPTVPSTLFDELATNPFLRASEPGIVSRYGGASAVEVFARLRQEKDQF